MRQRHELSSFFDLVVFNHPNSDAFTYSDPNTIAFANTFTFANTIADSSAYPDTESCTNIYVNSFAYTRADSLYAHGDGCVSHPR
jgi:hypothetical protein